MKVSELTEKEKFCLSGYVATGNADMAWRLSRPTPVTATSENVHRLALRWLRKPQVKCFVEELRNKSFKQIESTSVENRTKEQMVTELNTLANSVTEPKLKADILKQIADLQRMKEQTPEKEQSERRLYYLPYVSDCRHCQLMKTYMEVQRMATAKK